MGCFPPQILYFGELNPHLNFQIPKTTPSVRNVTPRRDKRENTLLTVAMLCYTGLGPKFMIIMFQIYNIRVSFLFCNIGPVGAILKIQNAK